MTVYIRWIIRKTGLQKLLWAGNDLNLKHTSLDPGIPVPRKWIQREEMGERERESATLTPEKFHP